MVSLCFCFPPSAKIRTNRGQILISDLETSDQILTTKLQKGLPITKKSPFVSYLHFDPELEANFLTLKHSAGSEIRISEDHLIFKAQESNDNVKWIAVRAKSLEIGDRLIHFDEVTNLVSYPRILEIESEVIRGAFAPLSMRGTLLVDNVLTSCYADIDSHYVAHASFAPFRFLQHLKNLNKSFKKSNENQLIEPTRKCHSSQGIHKYALALAALRSALPEIITPN